MVRFPAWAHMPAASGRGRVLGGRPNRPAVPHIGLYRDTVRGPILGGQAQGTVSALGVATVRIGPAGVGTRWYPAQATISTSTGAADTSTCTIYAGALNVPNLLVGQSYAGGGDTVGLAVPMMQPGDLLIAQWTGAHAGDLATINIVGDQEALTIGGGP